MKKLKKVNYNLILGTLLGFVLAQIVILEGYAIIAQKEKNIEMISTDFSNLVMRKFKIVAVLVFLFILILFNTKKFKKIRLDKISVYLILVILISIFVAIESVFLLFSIIFKIYPQIIEIEPFFLINISYGIFILGIIIFLITFVLLVNRKVSYIKFLTKEVKVIKNEGFGKTIEVKGGDELADLCESINNMSVELGKKIENEKEIEKNKNELITNISHDLKTPLTSIVGYLELLNNDKIDEEAKKEYSKIAYNKSLRLKELVNELFEYTKLASNDVMLEKNKINIGMLLNQAIGENLINFIERDIEVVLDNPYGEVYCNIDAIKILRVFENLLKNVEKYADSNSKFLVSLRVVDKKVLISFTNKCESIKNEDVERLFERFYREDKARSKEGSGLGLAIVKRIIELHNGTITAEKIEDNIKFNIKLEEA